MATSTGIPMCQLVEDYIVQLQEDIAAALKKLDSDPNVPAFKHNSWLGAQGGRGPSCVFAVPVPPQPSRSRSGRLREGRREISVMHGTLLLPPPAIKQMRAVSFFAAGLFTLATCTHRPYTPTTGTSRSPSSRRRRSKRRGSRARSSRGGSGAARTSRPRTYTMTMQRTSTRRSKPRATRTA